MHLFRFFFTTLLISGGCVSVIAHHDRSDHLTEKQGLANNSINCIYRDSDGFLWLGTKQGLSRYHGHGFTTFRANTEDPTALQDDDIYTIHEDQAGMLWIGTYEGGLHAFNKHTGKFKNYAYDPQDAASIQANDIRCIHSDAKNQLWVGTWGGGLHVWNKKKQSFRLYSHEHHNLASDNITSLYEDKQHRLWVGTWGGGLHVYDQEAAQFTQMPDAQAPTKITAITPDRFDTNRLWIAAWGEGIFQFDKTSRTFRPIPLNLPSKLILCLWQDPEGKLWFGTEENGLYTIRFRDQRAQSVRNISRPYDPLRSGHVSSIYPDNANNIWLGTVGEGVHVLHPNKGKFQHITKRGRNALSHNTVMAIEVPEPGRLLVGTYGGGLNLRDGESKRFRYYTTQSGLSSNDIWTLLQDSAGLIWLGTWGGGLNVLDLETQAVKHYPATPGSSSVNSNDIRSVYEHSNGQIWIGAWGEGLNRYDRATATFASLRHDPNDPSTISSDNVWDMQEDKQGNLWIGTWGGGLNLYQPGTDTFRHFFHHPSKQESLSDDYIYCLHYQAGKEVLWVGTASGLNRFDCSTKTARRFFEEDGLPSNTITSIEADNNGFLWISTNKGLARLNPDLIEKKKDNPAIAIFKPYSPADGLQIEEFNQNASCSAHNGLLYFGGINGFNVFNPQDVMGNTHVPKIVITDVRKYGKPMTTDSPITYKKHLTLSYKDNFFSIEFAALNFIEPDANQYAYMLEGFDDQWNYTGNRTIAPYTNITGGEYVLKIKGSNNDGVWNEAGTALRITVVPPFWKTYPFYILCILFILTGFYLFYRIRLQRLRKAKQVLEEKVNERTAQVVRQKNEIESKNRDITDSISYAKRIQQAILPDISSLKKGVADCFVLFKPRDIVSGDFYWIKQADGRLYFSVADCTGHGVPGAMVSVIGHEALNRCLQEFKLREPDKILNALTDLIEAHFQNPSGEIKDGMDMVLCALKVNAGSIKLQYAGANNPLYLIPKDPGTIPESLQRYQKDGIYVIPANKQPVGKHILREPFTQHEMRLQKGDIIYLFTDGYPDQFGGPSGKKYLYKRFRQLLLDIHDKPMEQQKSTLNDQIEAWIQEGEEEQIDDICVIGVRL